MTDTLETETAAALDLAMPPPVAEPETSGPVAVAQAALAAAEQELSRLRADLDETLNGLASVRAEHDTAVAAFSVKGTAAAIREVEAVEARQRRFAWRESALTQAITEAEQRLADAHLGVFVAELEEARNHQQALADEAAGLIDAIAAGVLSVADQLARLTDIRGALGRLEQRAVAAIAAVAADGPRLRRAHAETQQVPWAGARSSSLDHSLAGLAVVLTVVLRQHLAAEAVATGNPFLPGPTEARQQLAGAAQRWRVAVAATLLDPAAAVDRAGITAAAVVAAEQAAAERAAATSSPASDWWLENRQAVFEPPSSAGPIWTAVPHAAGFLRRGRR